MEEKLREYMDISILTATRAVTQSKERLERVLRISILTATRAVTGAEIHSGDGVQISILTATRAVTWSGRTESEAILYFNPHRHKGGDSWKARCQSKTGNFNPHRHKGGDCVEIDNYIIFFISILTATRAVTIL